MNWLNLLLVGAAADLLWVVCRPPRRVCFDTREVADAGWSSGRINRVAALVAVCGVALVGVLGVVTAGPLIGAAAAATAAVASGACTSLLTRVLPKQVIAAYRRRQMAAVTPWLELVALYMAAGQSINTAVVSAAKRTTDPGLAAIRSQMGTALTAGVDPLTGLARVTADPAVQRLVTTIRSAETAG